MDLNSITGIVRIPLADPGTRKEGLLSLSLPRECFEGNSVPQFYGADVLETGPVAHCDPSRAPDAAASETGGAAAVSSTASRSDSHLPALDGVLHDLQAAGQGLAVAGQDLQQTRFATTHCDNDLRRMEFPLTRAERDTAQSDSSSVGRELEFLVAGFRNDMASGEQSAHRTSTGANRVGDRLSSAQRGLQTLVQDLGTHGEKYGPVLSALDRASTLLEAGSRGVRDVQGDTQDGARSLEFSDGQMLFGETSARQIAFDAPGRDVSMAARQLHQAVDQATWNLQDAERRFDSVRWPLDDARRDIDQAMDVLQEARRALEQMQG